MIRSSKSLMTGGRKAPKKCEDVVDLTANELRNMRVLVAFEDVHAVYSDIIGRAIRLLQPGLDVRSSVLEELERDLVSFDPHMVICSRPPKGTHPSTRRGAWVHIPTDDGLKDDERLARIYLDGEHWKTTDGPPPPVLVEVLAETHERLGEGALSETCRGGGNRRGGSY
jgi:hypothetical protein